MVALKNYIVTEYLHESLGRGVSLGVRRCDGAMVIIKTPPSESPSSRDVECLQREYAMGRRIESPYVIRPEELDRRESQPLLIYPDFSGRSLAQMTGAPFETGRFLDIAVQLTAALADIHRQGIVHRDIKPANILIPARDGLEIKLTGFGIAAPPVHHTVASDEGLIEGSPPYMSPEQTGRMNRGVDQRSDLYSLGVTFYEMLTGTLPFQATDLPEWVHCHIAREPKPPRELVSTIPGPLAAMVMKLLAKPAEARYQSAGGLRYDLQRCREQWSSCRRIVEFTLGEKDVSPCFWSPTSSMDAASSWPSLQAPLSGWRPRAARN
jgi:serine/threonine protein kinase